MDVTVSTGRQDDMANIQSLQFLGCGFMLLMQGALLWRQWQKRRERKQRRRWYVRPINLSRPLHSEFHSLVGDFYSLQESEGHQEYFRMDETRLQDLLRRVMPFLTHRPTHSMPINAALRLSLTIKVLASGDSLKNTAKSYRIGYKTARNILYETCDALWTTLQPDYLSLPTLEGWQEVARGFWDKWQFPLCLGAIDGKHVVIKKPPKAGSTYFNYKLDHSIILLGVVDADYSFLYIDVGAYGRNHDGGVFSRSEFGKALDDEATNKLNIPGYNRLPGSEVVCPHVFIGDDAFPIGPHMIKPFGGQRRCYSQRLFDYRLSRARGVVENAFGILAARWRILHQPIACHPKNVVRMVKAIVVLHNYLKKTDGSLSSATGRYIPPYMLDYANEADGGEIQEGAWRNQVPADAALQAMSSSRRHTKAGTTVRERYEKFFLTEEGMVPWQDRYV